MTMASPYLSAVRDDSHISNPGAVAGGPTSRRSFSPAQKLAYLAAYDTAIKNNGGSAYLRTEGLYSSPITKWQNCAPPLSSRERDPARGLAVN
ncbi:hypothetical protein BJ997_001657 [Cryobacterium roopkundense]|uniref:Uncharacterized protein n=1 Tax=Cryobacterium roopkundense TaxID=1001240 RepID=A0A7W9E467_9MICO|nr:hypothetical protein [Cryobacterium roopkundense]